MSDEPKIMYFKPEQCGYLRRPDLDRNGITYEMPDGQIYVFPPGQVPLVTKLMEPLTKEERHRMMYDKPRGKRKWRDW